MSWWTSLRNTAEDITAGVLTGGFVNREGVSNPGETLNNIKEDVSGVSGGLLGGGDPGSNIYDPFKAYRPYFGSKLANLSSGNTEFQPTDPSYKFRFDQGLEAVNRQMAAGGQLGSGLQMKSLMDYGQQSASQEYSNEWNRLASLAGIQQTMNVGQTPNPLMQNLGAGMGLYNAFSQSGLGSSLFGGGAAATNIGADMFGSTLGGAIGAGEVAGTTSLIAPETMAMFIW